MVYRDQTHILDTDFYLSRQRFELIPLRVKILIFGVVALTAAVIQSF